MFEGRGQVAAVKTEKKITLQESLPGSRRELGMVESNTCLYRGFERRTVATWLQMDPKGLIWTSRQLGATRHSTANIWQNMNESLMHKSVGPLSQQGDRDKERRRTPLRGEFE